MPAIRYCIDSCIFLSLHGYAENDDFTTTFSGYVVILLPENIRFGLIQYVSFMPVYDMKLYRINSSTALV